MSEEDRLAAMVAAAPSLPTITIDGVFALLQSALEKAVAAHGDKAKAFAWDVKGHFIEEIGDGRSGAGRWKS